MRALLDQEVEMEDLFEESISEDEEFFAKRKLNIGLKLKKKSIIYIYIF